jgi:hypothetical protein
MPTLEQQDRDEHNRVMRLRNAAKARPHLNQSRAVVLKERGNEVPRFTRDSKAFNLPMRVLGYSDAATLGDAVRKAIISAELARFHRSDGLVIHVKDGKPLTAEGARRLGVPWPNA